MQHMPLVFTSKAQNLPVIIYFHVLVGNACMCSYQTYSVAANGYVVVSIKQTNGSAPAFLFKDGLVLQIDNEITMVSCFASLYWY